MAELHVELPESDPARVGRDRAIVASLRPYAFDRLYGAFPEQGVKADAKAAVDLSADRYLKAIRG